MEGTASDTNDGIPNQFAKLTARQWKLHQMNVRIVAAIIANPKFLRRRESIDSASRSLDWSSRGCVASCVGDGTEGGEDLVISFVLMELFSSA